MRTRGSSLRSPQGTRSGGDPVLQTQVPGALGDERASAPSKTGPSEARVGGLGSGGTWQDPGLVSPVSVLRGPGVQAWEARLGRGPVRVSQQLSWGWQRPHGDPGPESASGPGSVGRCRMGLKTPSQTRRRPGSPGRRPRWTGSPCLPWIRTLVRGVTLCAAPRAATASRGIWPQPSSGRSYERDSPRGQPRRR